MILYEIAVMLWDVITSPLGQLLFWGVVTSGVLASTLIHYLVEDHEDQSAELRVCAAAIMMAFWSFNACTWFMGTLSWMIYSDLFFAVLTCLVWWKFPFGWLGRLTGLYALAFGLTVCKIRYGLDPVLYVYLSNAVYVVQLFVVRGWNPFHIFQVEQQPSTTNDGLIKI